MPVWLVRIALPLVRLFSKRYYTIAAGITTITQHDFEAPKVGTHSLRDFCAQIAQQGDEALKEPHVGEFDITGRAMKGWVLVAPDGLEGDDPLSDWIQRAVKCVGFAVDWEHHFDNNSPAYLQVSRDGLVLHLTEHHRDRR